MREAGDRTRGPRPTRRTRTPCTPPSTRPSTTAEVGEVLDGLLSAVAPSPGWSNALAAKLIALTIPGVPDVYQGSELLGAVAGRPRQPAAGRTSTAVLPCWAAGRSRPGAPKLRVTSRALRLRRDRPELFTTYAECRRRARRPTTCWPSTAAARSPSRPGCPSALAARGGWGDTTLHLPDGEWRDELTDVLTTGRQRSARCLSTYPVALLSRGWADVRGPFDVWAPGADSAFDCPWAMASSRCAGRTAGWWTPSEPTPTRRRETSTTAT